MFRAFARIFIILFAVGVYGSTNHQPIVHIKDTKLIGSLHKNHQVEMFLGLPFAVPPIGGLFHGFQNQIKKLLLINLNLHVFKTKELLIGIKG